MRDDPATCLHQTVQDLNVADAAQPSAVVSTTQPVSCMVATRPD
jgi:hypothetical protein